LLEERKHQQRINIMKRTIIEIVVVLLFIGYVIMTLPKPVNLSKVDDLEKQCDSLEVLIVKNKQQIDSITDETKKLESKNITLNNKLGDLNQKTKKLKEQHEKDIAYINNLSDNDVADLFAKEFTDIK
jgi:regulator of replication initiation timing